MNIEKNNSDLTTKTVINDNTAMSEQVQYDAVEQEEMFEPEEPIVTPFSPNQIKLSTPPMNLGDLIDMITYGWINFGTSYQRQDNLWTPKQQSRLIESILLGLRLPAFYFEEINKRQWNVIDGLQRCSAIRNFCVDKTLHLSDLEFLDKFNGFSYDDLPFELKRDIRMLPITVNKLEAGVPDQVKYILFKRLNTGGIELTSQEIRNAMYQGKAISLVQKLSQDEVFWELAGKRIDNKRKQREDFISRFLAFYVNNYTEYEPDLDNFINKAMTYIKEQASEAYMQKIADDFHKAMVFAQKIIGRGVFRKQVNEGERLKPYNKAYFEVIAASFSKMNDSELEQLLDNKVIFVQNMYTAMRESKSYNNAFSGGTGSRDSVKRRFTWFKSIIDYSLKNKKIIISDDNKIEVEEF